jgi:hypothetical protein
MYSTYEVETLARLQREEVVRQVAADRLAQEATGTRKATRALRRHLATTLRALATRLAPVATESATDVEVVVT